MKQKFILWLSLLAVFCFSLQSCRNEYLSEKEQYSNGSAFQLTSKRISINQSKHKERLLPELEKVKTGFKSNTFGKTVNYGNGVSIDTDDVIYIENGPNYNTYTFRINRENAPTDAPVENLVLSPLSDGTYRELMVTYTLTPSEKQQMKNGIQVDMKGKAQITELAKGTYNNGGLTNKLTCGWGYEIQYTACSSNEHFHGELPTSLGGPCSATTPSTATLVAVYKCTDITDPNDPGTGWWAGSGTEGEGTGGTSGASGTESGCTGSGVSTEPQDPNTTLGTQDGCNTGTPTIPNLGSPTQTDPCKTAQIPVSTINATLHTPSISAEINSLENHAANSFTEYATTIINTGTSIVAADPYGNNDPNNPGQVSISVPSVGDYLASAHTHPEHGAAPHSAKDFYNALSNAKEYPTFQGSFVFAHNGTKYAFVVKDRAKAEAFLNAYPFATNTVQPDGRAFNSYSQVGRDYNEILRNYMTGRLPSYSGSTQNDAMESAWVQILEKYDTGISLAKTDNTGNLKPLRSVAFEYEIPASGGKKITGYKAMPCP